MNTTSISHTNFASCINNTMYKVTKSFFYFQVRVSELKRLLMFLSCKKVNIQFYVQKKSICTISIKTARDYKINIKLFYVKIKPVITATLEWNFSTCCMFCFTSTGLDGCILFIVNQLVGYPTVLIKDQLQKLI